MARFRLLFALGLIAGGTLLGALALSGYYDARFGRVDVSKGAVDKPTIASASVAQGFLRSQPRTRFVAVSAAADSKPAVKPQKTAPSKAPREAKPKAKDKRPVQKVEQAALPWPWNMFGN